MALAEFFDRVYGAVGGHLSISRDSLTDTLSSVVAGVRLGRSPSRNEQWIAEFSINLLARLYPTISIEAPPSIRGSLQTLALSINPAIDFAVRAPDELTLCIGEVVAAGAICPAAGGWVAYKLHEPLRVSGPVNPYSAAAASALGCAELFRRVFLHSPRERDIKLSLLDFGTQEGAHISLAKTPIGKALFVGVGAVGNAALWAMSRDRFVEGDLHVIDAEDLTLANLQRYVLGGAVDVGKLKVDLAESALAGGKLHVYRHACTLQSFVADDAKWDAIVVSVDNIEGRRVAQALLPRVVINGWTGERALGASWHLFNHEMACLACLYHPHKIGSSAIEQAAKALGLSVDRATLLWITRRSLADEDIESAAIALGVDKLILRGWRGKYLGDLYTNVVCGAVPLDIKGLGMVEAVPLAHQSALAGILMAAELIKRSSSRLSDLSQTEPLISWDDILREPPSLWTKPRPREAGCICTDSDYQQVYATKWLAGT